MNKKSICKECGKEFTYDDCSSAGVFCGKKCWLKNLKDQYKKIKCKQCGKTFSVKPSSKLQFCCYECAAKWLRGENHPACNIEERKRICENCGEEFIVNSKNSPQRFCSNKCASILHRGKNNHRYNLEERKRICKNCEKEFIVDYKNSSQIYCSNKCQGEFMSGKNSPLWNGGPSTYTCDYCGKEYEDYKSKENREHHFCSRNCVNKYFRGKRSPRWIDGLNRLYPNDFNNDLKESIRERDERVCQICGKSEEECHCNLHVHHIDRDKFNLKEYNLISLCPHCHSKVHANKDFEKKHLGDNYE